MPVDRRARHCADRRFGARVAVSDLSLSLHAGEIVALLGPNGAGKTTTLRMLAGLIPPPAAQIELQGVPLTPSSADALRRHIGLLTEAPGLWDRLSGSPESAHLCAPLQSAAPASRRR